LIVIELKTQLKEKEEKIEKYEVEITSLKEELEKIVTQLNTNLNFEKSSVVLDEIIIYQKSPLIKTGLGYNNNQNTLEEDESSKSIEEKSKISRNVLKGSNCSEDNNMERKYNQPRSNRNKLRRVAPPRRQFTTKYQNFFFGYCFCCNMFGHRAVDCRVHARNNHVSKGSVKNVYVENQNTTLHKYVDIIIECWK